MDHLLDLLLVISGSEELTAAVRGSPKRGATLKKVVHSIIESERPGAATLRQVLTFERTVTIPGLGTQRLVSAYRPVQQVLLDFYTDTRLAGVIDFRVPDFADFDGSRLTGLMGQYGIREAIKLARDSGLHPVDAVYLFFLINVNRDGVCVDSKGKETMEAVYIGVSNVNKGESSPSTRRLLALLDPFSTRKARVPYNGAMRTPALVEAASRAVGSTLQKALDHVLWSPIAALRKG